MGRGVLFLETPSLVQAGSGRGGGEAVTKKRRGGVKGRHMAGGLQHTTYTPKRVSGQGGLTLRGRLSLPPTHTPSFPPHLGGLFVSGQPTGHGGHLYLQSTAEFVSSILFTELFLLKPSKLVKLRRRRRQ